MIKKTNVVKLATRKTRKKPATKKPVVAKKKTKTTDINKLAKDRVEKLLTGVPMDLKDKKEESGNTENVVNTKADNWLEEQVRELNKENDKLRTETAEAKENYNKIHEELINLKSGESSQSPSRGNVEMIPDSLLKNNVIDLFNDVQNNMLGINRERVRYSNIVPLPFLNKMLNLFPFTKEIKKY